MKDALLLQIVQRQEEKAEIQAVEGLDQASCAENVASSDVGYLVPAVSTLKKLLHL